MIIAATTVNRWKGSLAYKPSQEGRGGVEEDMTIVSCMGNKTNMLNILLINKNANIVKNVSFPERF